MAGQTIFDPTEVTTSAKFKLFTLAYTDGTKGFVYGKAEGAISAGAVCVCKGTDGDFDELATTLAAANDGAIVAVAQTAIPDNSYGWLQVWGLCDAIEVNAGVTTGASLHTTSTPGRIDDADTTGNIYGIRVEARTTIGNTTGVLNFPTISIE